MRRSARYVAITAVLSFPCLADSPASNDPSSQFRDGMFLLPDLENPKEFYLIIIEPYDGREVVQLTLPQGSTGLRVSKAALPSGDWKWKYKVLGRDVTSLELKTPQDLRIGAMDLVDGRFSLVWKPVPDTKRYVISGQTRTKVSQDDDPPWSKIESSCFASVCARGSLATSAIELKTGTEVKWQITALDAEGNVLAKSEEAHIQMENSWVQRISESGLKLQRSDTLSKSTAQLPATLSFLSNKSTGDGSGTDAYQGEFALIYDGAESWGGFWPRVSLEGKLTSTGDQKDGDQLRFRAGGYRIIAGNDLGEGTEFITNLKYETERKTGTKKGLIEVGVTPVYGWLGRYWPGPPNEDDANAAGNYVRLPWLQVAPIISFGAETGKTFDVGGSSETNETIVRLRTTLRLDAQLNALSYAIGTRNVTPYLEGSYWYLPLEDEVRNYRLGKAGMSFGLTEMLSFDLSYSVGREAPNFTFARTKSIGFGLKF